MNKAANNLKEHVIRVFSYLLLFALLFSFTSTFPLLSLDSFKDNETKSCLNFQSQQKIEIANSRITSDPQIPDGRRFESKKNDIPICALPLFHVNAEFPPLISRRCPLYEYFLSKCFLNLEILSSRNHPPTFFI